MATLHKQTQRTQARDLRERAAGDGKAGGVLVVVVQHNHLVEVLLHGVAGDGGRQVERHVLVKRTVHDAHQGVGVRAEQAAAALLAEDKHLAAKAQVSG